PDSRCFWRYNKCQGTYVSMKHVLAEEPSQRTLDCATARSAYKFTSFRCNIACMEPFSSPAPFSLTHTQFNEGNYSSTPFSLLVQELGTDPPLTPPSPSISLLVQEQDLDPPFTPSSPSLDMQAALQHLRSTHSDLEMVSGPNFSDDSDVLMVDPFLDYLNEVLMEEQGVDDVSFMREDVEAAYNAIVSSLHDIIREHLPLDSTSSEGVSAFDKIDENASGSHVSHASDKSSQDEVHAYTFESCNGLSNLTRESHVLKVASDSLFAYGIFDVSLEQEKVGTLPANQEIAQNYSYNGSLETAHVSNFSFNNGGKGQDQERQALLNNMFVVKPSSMDISLEEFEVKAGYEDLYVGKPSAGNTKRPSGGAEKGIQAVKNINANAVNWGDLLVGCAQAVGMADMKKATEILQELYQIHGASVKGNSLQRMAHYFCDALMARMGGIGGHLYRVICENRASAVSFLRASRMWYRVSPYMKIVHFFANQNILKAAEGASRLHILDYGISYGMQWPCLINALADREGGPPLLVITGIDSSKQGPKSLEWLEENGRRLAAYAKTYDVPFQFHAIVSDNWVNIDPASLYLQESEVLVINCIKRLYHHADESVDSTMTTSHRQKLLMSMRSLNPHLLLIAEINSAGNSPFFVTRFREALNHYSNIIDMLDTLYGDDPDRLVTETKCCARDIVNMVACEGAERVERPETYKEWDARIKRAGFELLPVSSVILYRSRSHVRKHYHKHFIVHDDANGWMLLGWKGRIILSMSAWKHSLNR
ncbi:hypothetical protein GOP47_0006856, partial [Adiantum capillus-veneris]